MVVKTRSVPRLSHSIIWLLKTRWRLPQKLHRTLRESVSVYCVIFVLLLAGLLIKLPTAQGQVTTYTYDETTSTNGISRLTSVSDPSGSARFYYDNMGRTTKTAKGVDGTTYTVQTGYDILGRISSITYPDTSVVNYAYTGSLVDRVYEGSTTYVQYSGYNALGQPATMTTGNNVTTAYTYSNVANATCNKQNFRVCTVTVGSFQTLTYQYDNDQPGAGNITFINDTANGNQTFAYDALNRLTSAIGPYNGITYAYDQIGNMTCNSQISACSQTSSNYTYPVSGAGSTLPHAVSVAGTNSYSYDLNGNLTQGAGRSISYDADNRPVSINTTAGSTTFVYDSNGARVKKVVGGTPSTTTIYIGKFYECTGGACSKYIFAGGQRIALKSVGTTDIRYFHANHLGSSSVITDQTGALYQRLAYYPYGQTRFNSLGSTSGVYYKYTGQMLDDSTGLYYYKARYYDPALGRFISADTIIPSRRNPQFLNHYSYTLNNPIMMTDPSGLEACGIWTSCGTSEPNNPCNNGGSSCGSIPPITSLAQNSGQTCPPGGCLGMAGTGAGLGLGSGVQAGFVPGPTVAGTKQNLAIFVIAALNSSISTSSFEPPSYSSVSLLAMEFTTAGGGITVEAATLKNLDLPSTGNTSFNWQTAIADIFSNPIVKNSELEFNWGRPYQAANAVNEHFNTGIGVQGGIIVDHLPGDVVGYYDKLSDTIFIDLVKIRLFGYDVQSKGEAILFHEGIHAIDPTGLDPTGKFVIDSPSRESNAMQGQELFELGAIVQWDNLSP